eukprot:g707.t1
MSREYIKDRVATDEPIAGYMVRDAAKGGMQGFIFRSTFTTWQQCFRWNRSDDGRVLGIRGEDRKGRACDDGTLAAELAAQPHAGDVLGGGVVWPTICELSLLGGLGCGGWLVSLLLAELELEHEPGCGAARKTEDESAIERVAAHAPGAGAEAETATEAEVSILWWLRSVDSNPNAGRNREMDRLQVQLNGCEYMMYNNSYAYDDIEELKRSLVSGMGVRDDKDKDKDKDKGKGGDKGKGRDPKEYERGVPPFYVFCPITAVHITTGVVYVGAPRLPTVLVVNFSRADINHYVRMDAEGEEPGLAPQDLYRSHTDVQLRDAEVRSIRNEDYIGEKVLLQRKTALERETIIDDAINSFERMVKAARGLKKDLKEVRVEDFLRRDFLRRAQAPAGERERAAEDVDAEPIVVDIEEDDDDDEDEGKAADQSHGDASAAAGVQGGKAQRASTSQTRRRSRLRKEPPILRTSCMRIKYIFDQPGLVTPDADETASSPLYKVSIELGDPRKVDSTFISYGPWADRQRKLFMQYFFPFNFQDRHINAAGVGEERLPNDMEVAIHTHHATTWQVPYVMTELAGETQSFKNAAAHAVEEQASNAETVRFSFGRSVRRMSDASVVTDLDSVFCDETQDDGTRQRSATDDGVVDKPQSKETEKLIREFDGPIGAAEVTGGGCGWLEIDFSAGSEIKVAIPWTFVSPDGEHTIVQAVLREPEVRSSLTHAPFLKCQPDQQLQVECNMHYPVGWNARHEWSYGIDCGAAQLWFLRQHVAGFVDLIADWTAPVNPNEYMWDELPYFIPVNYQYDMQFSDLDLWLNANTDNVIDVPNMAHRNRHVILHLPCVAVEIATPALEFDPPTTAIDWTVQFMGDHPLAEPSADAVCALRLQEPQDHPEAQIYGCTSEKSFWEFKKMELQGKWVYYNKFAPTYVDMITLDFDFEAVQVELTPDSINVLCIVQENYFGSVVYPISSFEYELAGNRNLLTYLAMRKQFYSASGEPNPFNECEVNTTMALLVLDTINSR